MGLDMVLCLRGLERIEFWDFGTWLEKKKKLSVRDYTFVQDVNNSVQRPKQPHEHTQSQLRNLTPLLDTYAATYSEWMFVDTLYPNNHGAEGPVPQSVAIARRVQMRQDDNDNGNDGRDGDNGDDSNGGDGGGGGGPGGGAGDGPVGGFVGGPSGPGGPGSPGDDTGGSGGGPAGPESETDDSDGSDGGDANNGDDGGHGGGGDDSDTDSDDGDDNRGGGNEPEVIDITMDVDLPEPSAGLHPPPNSSSRSPSLPSLTPSQSPPVADKRQEVIDLTGDNDVFAQHPVAGRTKSPSRESSLFVRDTDPPKSKSPERSTSVASRLSRPLYGHNDGTGLAWSTSWSVNRSESLMPPPASRDKREESGLFASPTPYSRIVSPTRSPSAAAQRPSNSGTTTPPRRTPAPFSLAQFMSDVRKHGPRSGDKRSRHTSIGSSSSSEDGERPTKSPRTV
ncbi:hypothetical protein B0I35DRAFT_478039 [Stachybotrys elegans]|uniref:Uncharacterized protein n=1 Tax=Stachybotrys elegans TaxID=80388 RepID=A0A8K0WR87_9HYPO|nr:hypothetical protein B0I35DRAFT_478039 [Stachybotrys elegans]